MTDTATRNRGGFNADERAAAREASPVVIGGQTFKPVRRTTRVMRDVRAIGRAQERLNREATKLSKDAAEALEAGDDARYEELEAQADGKSDDATGRTFVMLAALLAAGDQGTGEHPEPGFLEDHLDLVDAERLADHLMGDGDDAADPSKPTATTTD